MRTRAWRWLLVIVLLACGAGAAWSGWISSRQIAELDRRQRDLNDDVDGLMTTLDAATTAQLGRVSASPGHEPDLASTLIDQLHSDAERLQPHVRSLEAGRALQSMAASVSTLREINVRAEEHLRLGQDLMAADLLSSDGRAADEAIGMSLRQVRASENDAYAAARADAIDAVWTVAGGAAALWILGFIVLTPRSVDIRKETVPVESGHTLLLAPIETPQDFARASDLDLQDAADVCTAIGRLSNAEELPRLLQRAALVMEASGIVVWMAAGEELFAAAAFGYTPQVIQKLGPINRAAVNATAAAWRSSVLQTVSGGGTERSALAAPLLGPERCIGVLAVEVNPGREAHATTRAVTTLVAAQLAAALQGWPAASAAAPLQAPPLDRAAEA
jgi:hypothetical protein